MRRMRVGDVVRLKPEHRDRFMNIFPNTLTVKALHPKDNGHWAPGCDLMDNITMDVFTGRVRSIFQVDIFLSAAHAMRKVQKCK